MIDNLGPVDRSLGGADPLESLLPGLVIQLHRPDEGLGRDAPHVHTGASDLTRLHQAHFETQFGAFDGGREAG